MIVFPEPPDLPADQRANAQGFINYEDAAQDGRILLLAMPHFMGLSVRQHLMHHPLARGAARMGVLPILSRMVIEGTDASISMRRPVSAAGCFQLAHTVSAAGEVDRIILNMWVSLTGAKRRPRLPGGTPPPPSDPTAEPEMVAVGRVYGENVFTRLHAAPDQRKVLRLEVPGIDAPPVPPARHGFRGPDAVLALPEGAEPLDDELRADPADVVVFGLTHTDANQHVNSLVYPRLFEDAALRRFAARGRSAKVLARSVEIAYRKPCFAGDEMRVLVRSYAHGDVLGAVGAFAPPSGTGRPHCWLHMRFA
jgi:hypothetical protein